MVSKDIRRLLSRLDPATTACLERAVGACAASEHREATPVHLLHSLCGDESGEFAAILSTFRMDRDRLRDLLGSELRTMRPGSGSRPVFSTALLELLEAAWAESSLNLGAEDVGAGAILLACQAILHQFPPAIQDVLRRIPFERLRSEFESIRPARGEGSRSAEGGDSRLSRFTVDLVDQARQGRIDPVLGRDDEIRQVVDILCRRRKNNPILVGEAGVGKTAVVEGLALRIAGGDVPASLRDARVLSLDLGLLAAGAGVRGEFESRLKGLVSELRESARPAILFIDEAHALVGAGGEAGRGDAANLLKPELARGDLRCVAATTFSEFRRHLEKDPAIARRFQQVVVPEPEPSAAAAMLRGIAARYESFHGVRISEQAVRAACELSHRHLPARQLPDKAIDLLDTAAARVRSGLECRPARIERLEVEARSLDAELLALEREGPERGAGTRRAFLEERREALGEEIARLGARWTGEDGLVRRILATKDGEGIRERSALLDELRSLQGDSPLVHAEVGREVLCEVLEEWTGIPAGSLGRDEARSLLDLEDLLGARVVGQRGAVSEVARAIRSARMGLGRPEAPLGVFLLAGPTGTGKTELAKALADILYGGERSATVLSMSEYQESISVTALKGASAGYVGYGDGGTLTEGVRRNPWSVVVLDEVEKAHKDVLQMFYQVFDQGSLRDGEGREVRFRDAVVVMTSNLGARTLAELAASKDGIPSHEECVRAIAPEIADHFGPALLARCRIVPFLPLDAGALRRIAEQKFGKLARRVQDRHGIPVDVPSEIVQWVQERCLSSGDGARALDALMEQEILPRLSDLLLRRIAEGGAGSRIVAGLDRARGPSFSLSDEDGRVESDSVIGAEAPA